MTLDKALADLRANITEALDALRAAGISDRTAQAVITELFASAGGLPPPAVDGHRAPVGRGRRMTDELLRETMAAIERHSGDIAAAAHEMGLGDAAVYRRRVEARKRGLT